MRTFSESLNKVNNFDCTVIGDAIIDIVVPVYSFDPLGTALVGGILNTDYAIYAGGTANVAAGISTLGATSAFIGRVGADCFGKLFMEGLKEAEVESRVSVSATRKTGLAIAISSTSDKDRFFIVDRGANIELSPNDVDYDLAHNSHVVYFTGFSLQDLNVSKAVISFIEEASRNDRTIVFNPGTHNVITSSRMAIIDAVRRFADVVILNYKEGQRISQFETDEQIIEFLLSLGVGTIALTKGEKGSIISTRASRNVFKADPVDVVDSTGAGDAYAAGIIYAMLKGWKLERAGRFATRVAQTAVRQKGPRCNFKHVPIL
jgi:sugar/nucleoside kinase (ribokinase family)